MANFFSSSTVNAGSHINTAQRGAVDDTDLLNDAAHSGSIMDGSCEGGGAGGVDTLAFELKRDGAMRERERREGKGREGKRREEKRREEKRREGRRGTCVCCCVAWCCCVVLRRRRREKRGEGR
jgi:hypothetical protein